MSSSFFHTWQFFLSQEIFRQRKDSFHGQRKSPDSLVLADNILILGRG